MNELEKVQSSRIDVALSFTNGDLGCRRFECLRIIISCGC